MVATVVLQATQVSARPADRPSPIEGFWLGTLQISSGPPKRMQITVRSDKSDRVSCILDSLDDDTLNLTCANVTFTGTDFSFEVPSLGVQWSGRLSPDGDSLNGTYSQRVTVPLNFHRTAAPTPPPRPYEIAYGPAMAPMSADGIARALDRDLMEALKNGALAPETSAGVAIGVYRNGIRHTFAYGAAKPDAIFEIGSITKSFTGLALAQMAVQGKVRLDQPVRELLPAGTVAKPQAAEITLLDLITHHSGLPSWPDNPNSPQSDNPYPNYRAAQLYEFIAKHGVTKPTDTSFQYSNLGVGLLGQGLANRAAMTYSNLIASEITEPLRMHDTVIRPSIEQQARLIQGHPDIHVPADWWDRDALAGAGGLRSTADDMLTYLEANLHPESVVGKSRSTATLPTAIALSQEPQAAFEDMKIALGWLYDPESGRYWFDGATNGFSAYAFFDPKRDCAAVVLMNTAPDPRGSFVERLAEYIRERFSGEKAISLSYR